LGAADALVDFVGMVLEYLERPEIAVLKGVRLCSLSLGSLRSTFHRLVLFRLSELQDTGDKVFEVVEFLNKMMYWQNILLSPENQDENFTKLLCYLLYTRLVDVRDQVRLAAANVCSLGPLVLEYGITSNIDQLWRILLVQKPIETSMILNQAKTVGEKGAFRL